MTDRNSDPASILGAFGAKWSPDLDAYASGQLDVSKIRCILCTHTPCNCSPFGSAAYFANTDRLHGKKPSATKLCSNPDCPMTASLGEHPAGIAISERGPADASGHHEIISAACIVDA